MFVTSGNKMGKEEGAQLGFKAGLPQEAADIFLLQHKQVIFLSFPKENAYNQDFKCI